ncbi:hypothetical protein SRABI76_03538 [Microbacterium oxydans]|nr:hypothetical protein SRABI76_03538 [Microbacterium oxydans]
MSPISASADGSVTPPTDSPSPGCCFSIRTASPRSPWISSASQSASESVLDTTYFFVRPMASANGISHSRIQSGQMPVTGRRHADSII